MSTGNVAFERTVRRQIALNQARTPDQRFKALCDLLDSLRAMAPQDPEACERRRRVRLARARMSGSRRVPSADNPPPPGGPTLQQAFEALVATLNERGVRYAIIGGLAINHHTRVRATEDIDALLAVPQVEMPGLFDALADRGFLVDLRSNIRELRDDGFTAIRFGDVFVDLMRPMLPMYAHVLDRAVDVEVLGQRVRIGSAEGLIVTKLVAMRAQDEADIQELLAAYRDKLDLDYVRAELETFTEPDDPRRAKFESWVRQAREGG